MAHYKKDAASNRNALFGSSDGGGSAAPRAATARSAAATPSVVATAASSSSHSTSGNINIRHSDDGLTPGPSVIFAPPGRRRCATSSSPINLLTGAAKLTKMAEAESYRTLAKKAMTKSLFSRPDPIIAANYYKRAADAYAQCGEARLEKLHRIACGDCLLGQESYATAAVEYTRAAELAEESTEDSLERRRKECYKLHVDAANAYAQLGERGRYAESTMKGAFGLLMGTPKNARMDEKTVVAVEGAVESFLGDPLNRMKNYRQTGVSAFITPGDGASDKTAYELAKQQAVMDAYAHETLYKVSHQFIERRQYESALYAHGAGTAILELEGYATVSLYRAYLSETILLLAMGDGVAASHEFKNVHLQNTSYLSSRECALEEDLIRATEGMDGEALEMARSKENGGLHRSAMANLDPIMRELIMEIRVSGRAKKEKKHQLPPASGEIGSMPPSELTQSAIVRDTDACFEEMDEIMNQMGLNEDVGADDDDEFDLR